MWVHCPEGPSRAALMSPILPFWSAVLSWCITGPSSCTKGMCNMTQFSSPMGKLPWLTRHYWLDQQISDHKSVVFQKHIHKLWIQGHLSQPSHYSRLMSRWSNTYKGNVHAQFNRWNKGDALDRKGPNLWYMKPRCYGKSSGSLNPPTWDDGSSTTGSTVSYTR